MPKAIGRQIPVESSNIRSIGFYHGTESFPQMKVIKVEFLSGGIYEYWPCTEEEFQKAFEREIPLKEWFAELKVTRHSKQTH